MAYHKIDNFAHAASSSGIKQVFKNLPQVHELRAGIIRVKGTIKSTAASFVLKAKQNDASVAGGASDLQTMINKIITRVYLKRDDVEKVYNIAPVDAVIAYGGQHRRYMLASDLTDGDTIPASGGTAINWQIDLIFDWTHSGFGDTPNKFCPGTEQSLVGGGWEASYDSDSTGLTTLVLGNGTGNIVVSKVELGADIEPCDFPVVGPVWGLEYDKEPGLANERVGAAMELLVYDQALPDTFDTAVTSVDVVTDGNIQEVKTATGNDLADHYFRTQKGLDGGNPFRVERSCTPLRWVTSQVHPEEREYRYHLSRRAITFTGSSSTRNLARHRIYPFAYKAAAAFEAVKAAYYPGVKTSWDKAMVRFPGRDGLLDATFGARFCADF